MANWKETLEDLVRRRGGALVGYGYLLTGNSRDAEDLFHDAVVRTFSRGKGSVTLAEAEAYVRRAMFSAHMDAGRREQTWRRIFHLVKQDATSGDAGGGVEFRTDVQVALAHLSPRERACTILRYYDDLTAAAIGRELGISEGAVRRYLSDAAVKLRGALGAIDDDPTRGVSYTTVHDTTTRRTWMP